MLICRRYVRNGCFNTTFVTVLLQSNQALTCILIVSIQLLLLFYAKSDVYKCPGNAVSIQLLLLFYRLRIMANVIIRRFQYNFCYCSIRRTGTKRKLSFVSIQLLLLFYASPRHCFRSPLFVSIQLLLLFYAKDFYLYHKSLLFQYNFCYCSMIFTSRKLLSLCKFQYNFCYCSILLRCR